MPAVRESTLTDVFSESTGTQNAMAARELVPIGKRAVGHDAPTFIIAEAGVCHFGSLEAALRLVDVAVEAGADAVKFQVYCTERLVSAVAAEWRERLKPKELTPAAFGTLQAYCLRRGIIFLATPHEEESADLLERLDVPAFKVGSGEVGNWRYLEYLARKGRPMLVSTGMYTHEEVGEAINAIRRAGNDQIVLLHCVTRYPAEPEMVNLKAIETLRKSFGVPVGYSDHTVGIEVPLAAVAVGACVIEKHIALDLSRSDSQDVRVACDPEGLRQLVRGIRVVEKARGSGEKQPALAEMASRDWARKSVVARVAISAGAIISEGDLCLKRPGTGIPPLALSQVVGRRARVPIAAETLIQWDMVEDRGAAV